MVFNTLLVGAMCGLLQTAAERLMSDAVAGGEVCTVSFHGVSLHYTPSDECSENTCNPTNFMLTELPKLISTRTETKNCVCSVGDKDFVSFGVGEGACDGKGCFSSYCRALKSKGIKECISNPQLWSAECENVDAAKNFLPKPEDFGKASDLKLSDEKNKDKETLKVPNRFGSGQKIEDGGESNQTSRDDNEVTLDFDDDEPEEQTPEVIQREVKKCHDDIRAAVAKVDMENQMKVLKEECNLSEEEIRQGEFGTDHAEAICAVNCKSIKIKESMSNLDVLLKRCRSRVNAEELGLLESFAKVFRYWDTCLEANPKLSKALE